MSRLKFPVRTRSRHSSRSTKFRRPVHRKPRQSPKRPSRRSPKRRIEQTFRKVVFELADDEDDVEKVANTLAKRLSLRANALMHGEGVAGTKETTTGHRAQRKKRAEPNGDQQPPAPPGGVNPGDQQPPAPPGGVNPDGKEPLPHASSVEAVEEATRKAVVAAREKRTTL